MKSKRDLPFPDPKLEKKTIKERNETMLTILQTQLKLFKDDINMMYQTRYEASVWGWGCDGKDAPKFLKIADKADKAILKLM